MFIHARSSSGTGMPEGRRPDRSFKTTWLRSFVEPTVNRGSKPMDCQRLHICQAATSSPPMRR